ncbi:polysaccharide pyruvyl transferase family protein [Leifsonia aquatica]|uniref:polysaccharide pyruvyl transferase family protein n=1 Tax=Leifsonia aquatica TaxID=144185 RepID=UPI000469BDDB|nr:polysaccharide pyruvyl transferase family protein [Leifsonia aquatica]
MKSTKRSLIYLGWQGNDNFGDELLYDSWKVALDDSLEFTAPLTLGRYLVKEAGHFARTRTRVSGTERLLLLGGGTTIGFRTWADHTRLARRMFGATGMLIPGAGAAESGDEFLLSKQPHDWAAWRNEPQVGLLGVRGPLTAAECASYWQPAGVIGDPALLYPRHTDITTTPANTIGLCLGSEGTSRFDVADVAQGVRRAAEELGASITLFEVTPADAPVTEQLVRLLGREIHVIRFDGDVRNMMREIARCRIMVSERLHGVVAAVVAEVPAVPLAYASKCDDFWLSVAGERAALKPGLSQHQLVEEVRRSLSRDRLQEIASRTQHLGNALERAADSIKQWMAGDLPTHELLALRAPDLVDGTNDAPA